MTVYNQLIEKYLVVEAVTPRVTRANVEALYNLYIRVESSNVHSIYYDPDDRNLRVRFLSGAEYEYYNVSERIFIALLNAPSHGKEFWRKVRDIYSYTRLSDWDGLDIEDETVSGDAWDRYEDDIDDDIDDDMDDLIDLGDEDDIEDEDEYEDDDLEEL